MHYYQFNIGDYAVHTAHLEPLEDLAYRRLLDLYYLTEKPIPLDLDSVSRLIRMRPHCDCIAFVLGEFFSKTAKGFINKRADNEICTYKGKSGQASAAAKARWDKVKQKQKVTYDADALQAHSGRNAKHKTLNTKQETITNKDIAQDKPAKKTLAKPELDYSVWPEQPDQQILTDWLTHRKSKRAAVSQTVVNACGEEFRKAATFGYSVNDCLKSWLVGGWQGFKFEWMQNQLSRGNQNAGQPKTSLIDRFIQNNYAGSGFEDDNRPMGSDGGAVRGQVVEPVRGDAGRIGPMETDLIGDYTAADSGSAE